jgi:hypothetical protein
VRAPNKLIVTTLAAGLLCLGHPGTAAATDTRGGRGTTPAQPLGPIAHIANFAPHVTVLRFDEFETDSVLEVDRSINAETGGSGTVGSDREGGAGD